MTVQQGVSDEFIAGTACAGDEKAKVMLSAVNNSANSKRAWVSVERVFEQPVNLSGKGMGLWVHGDGTGALLNIQLRNPRHVTFA